MSDALEVIKHRRDFYRDSYRKLAAALFIAVLAIVGLIGVIFVLVSTRPTPTYFATTDSGRVIPLIPLNQPNLSDRSVLQWVSGAVTSVYSYNFVNFREAFQSNKQYFTNPGWDSFMKALSESKNLQAVRDEKLVVSAVLTGAPIVISRTVIAGRYSWKVQMPIQVTYQGTGSPSAQRLLVTLTINRVSTLDSRYGIGINNFVAQQQ